MRSITALLALLIIVLSCGKRDQGELIGVKTKKFIRVNPHGMVEIPGGSFIMGSSDEDIIDAQNDITRTMTIRTFYMDETEITNREYMQFIEWVKDSIIRTELAKKSILVALKDFKTEIPDPTTKNANQSWYEFNEERFKYIFENYEEDIKKLKVPNLDNNPENDVIEDLTKYYGQRGNILKYFPDISNFVGEEQDNEGGSSSTDDFSDLNGYQLLMRYRAENPIVLWLRDHYGLSKVEKNEFKNHLPLNREIDLINNWFSDDNRYDIHYAEVMNDIIYLPEDDCFQQDRCFNTKILKYRFSEIDSDRLLADMKNPDKVGTIKRSDYLIYDEVSIYPDTTVWIKDFKYSYNESMFNEYFHHPAYADYPVVGVSWKQAKAFANWRTKYRNDYLRGEKNKTIVGQFRLPTEAEWEYAARGGKQSAIYPWGGPYLVDNRGNFLANFKPKRGDYAADNIVYTAEVDSYEPNDFGLYNMSGNVAEWTSSPYYNESYEFNTTFNPDVYMPGNERKVVRGGSWKDVAYFLKVGSRDYEYADSAKSYIGLRLVRDYLGSNSR